VWAGALAICVNRFGTAAFGDGADDGTGVMEDSEGLPEGRIATGSATAEESAMVAVLLRLCSCWF
jgi:hypothetical protein